MTSITIALSDETFALLVQKATALGVTAEDVVRDILAERLASNDASSPDHPEFIAAMNASFRRNVSLLRRLGDLDER